MDAGMKRGAVIIAVAITVMWIVGRMDSPPAQTIKAEGIKPSIVTGTCVEYSDIRNCAAALAADAGRTLAIGAICKAPFDDMLTLRGQAGDAIRRMPLRPDEADRVYAVLERADVATRERHESRTERVNCAELQAIIADLKQRLR